MNENQSNSIPVIVGGLVIEAIVLGGSFALINNGQEAANSNVQTETEDTSSNVIGETTTSNPPEETELGLELVYNNGEYTAVGTYTSPAGSEEVEVKLNIENDTITAVDVMPKATNPVSVKLQNAFKDEISNVIVGKNINEVEYPGNVNGSSLTGYGFIEAVEQIKANALI